MKNHIRSLAAIHRASSPTLLTAFVLLAAACSDAPTASDMEISAPLFKKPGGPPPGQAEGTPLRARSLTGVMTDDVDEFGDYEDGVDDMAVHLSGVNGNLMFRTADPPTLREVFVTVDGIAGDGYTRTFTNETTVDGVLRADGLRDLPPDGGQEIRTKLDSQFRDVAGKSYLLRYGRDCFGMFNNDDLDVTFASSTWTLEGSNAVLCERVKKGKNKLVPVGGDGGAVGAPLTIVLGPK